MNNFDRQRQSIHLFFETFGGLFYQYDYNFTFETEDEQRQAELQTGYIDSFDCVRMVVRHPQGGEIDFPVKNRESFEKLKEFHGSSIVSIYPTVHSYDVENYL